MRGTKDKFSLFKEADADCYQLIKVGIVGGPAIIYHRYHEKNVTKIRPNKYGGLAKLCKLICGYDCNAL